MDKASDFGSEDWGFESLRGHIFFSPLFTDSQIVRFDRSDSLCAIGCGNGTIEIVELNADLTRYQLNGHTASVNGLHFDPCANVLASASADGTVKLWN